MSESKLFVELADLDECLLKVSAHLASHVIAASAARMLDGLEDIKLQLNNHSRAFSALTTEVRKAVELLPPLHNVVPLNDDQAVLQAPSFNLPLREIHELAELNMQLSDKANLSAFVSASM